MEFTIPNYVKTLLDKLEQADFEAFIVGGSIRDILLGSKPSDYDITTDARPEQIETVFKDFKTILVGKEFGTVVVVQKQGNVEITTYRIEDEYLDGRRPSFVSFSSNIEEDLKRRDFTINAIAYSEKRGLVDPFGGKDDLEKKIIRTVGDPRERFSEDHLRILRGVRFSTSLQFKIEDETLKASKDMAYLLAKISAERIRDELFKILLSKKPSYGIRILYELDILEIIIPELIDTIGFNQQNPHHKLDVFEHLLCVLDQTPANIEIRLAALFHDIGKPSTFSLDEKGIGHFYGHQDLSSNIAVDILKRLRIPNDIIYTVEKLIDNHMTYHNDYSSKGLKRLIKRVGKREVFYLIDLQKADIKCKNKSGDTSFLKARKDKIIDIINKKEPVEKKQLAINGNDIVNLGYKEGRMIGVILDYLLEIVLEEPELNDRSTLLKLVSEKFKK